MIPVTASNLFPYVDSLPETWQAILINLASVEVAWRTPEQVAANLGWDAEFTKDVLADLDVAGWLEVWERDDDLVVTLSPWAAEQLCLTMHEAGRSRIHRWVMGERPAMRRIDKKQLNPERLEHLADSAPTPDLLLEAAEGGHIHCDVIERRRPRVLLGMSLIPWPGPEQRRGRGPCASCGSRQLKLDTYCLLCDCWGRDEEIFGDRGAKLGEAISPGDCVDNLGMARARRERRRAYHNQRMGESRARSHSVAKARAKAQRAKWPTKPRHDGAAPTPSTKRAPSAN